MSAAANGAIGASQPAQPVLEVRKVSAAYSSYRALFAVSLTVPQRGIVALLGANGAGKSTLARVISGLVPVTEGSVIFAGRDVTHTPAHRIARLGLVQVPEGRAVFSSLTVEENLRLAFRHSHGRRSASEVVSKAFELFPVLDQRRRQAAGTLSGGEQRILSLAKVLAVPPKLLVVDELSLGLAPAVIDTIYEALVAVRDAGTALLVVEQHIDRALAIADTGVLLSRGSVVWDGPAADAASAMERLLSVGSPVEPAEPTPGGTPADVVSERQHQASI